jgi:hypothetical protein
VPQPLQAGQGRRRDEIMYLLFDALWNKGEQAWIGISRIVKERVPYPVITSGEAQECYLDPDDAREGVQVTCVDLTSLLNWTERDGNLSLLTPLLLVRGEYTELDKYLESSSEHVLLLGQPGIGSCINILFRP